ncbi:NADPH-dependent FMN reductase [Nonomuraea typhae]|uniref:NADPH-dependent FMN reductase n=1 Tax=Nonomuraea typhae TaxID=2603600 RepID=A0ABW7Z2L6_9ACTN
MNDGHPRLAVVTGSDHSAAALIAERACVTFGLEVDVIDLESACLPDPAPSRALVPPAVRDLRPWLVAAQGFVVVAVRSWTLRKAVFWCAEAWRAKPVALVTDPALLIPSTIDRMFGNLLRQDFS